MSKTREAQQLASAIKTAMRQSLMSNRSEQTQSANLDRLVAIITELEFGAQLMREAGIWGKWNKLKAKFKGGAE